MLYDEWMEEGKREIVKRVLQAVESSGLPPAHQLYFTFKTTYPGVQLPAILRALYPEEMNISIKDAFWNLSVNEEAFSLELLFNDQKHALRIPFKALVSFIDPAAEFGLQFDWEKNLPLQKEDNVIFLDQFRKS